MPTSSFVDLCPDILLDIFQYFSLNELFDTFIDVIPYLISLLHQTHVKLSIDQNANEDFWHRIVSQINSNQIHSIHNTNFISDLSQFSSLRSIHLDLQTSSLLSQLRLLIHLEQLSMKLSETILNESTWFSENLNLAKLQRLKIDLIHPKNLLIPQQPIFFHHLFQQSNTIKFLEIKLPISWKKLFLILHHFPQLQTFRAVLFQLNSLDMNRLTSIFPSPSFKSLQTLDFQGYFPEISSMIVYITSSMPNLKHCRLIAFNVTNDDAFRMKHAVIWKHLFQSCSHLIRLKLHLIMSIEVNKNFNNRIMKDLIWTFNNHSFCEKYHFQMEQLSINRGYVTLTADYDMKKKKQTN